LTGAGVRRLRFLPGLGILVGTLVNNQFDPGIGLALTFSVGMYLGHRVETAPPLPSTGERVGKQSRTASRHLVVSGARNGSPGVLRWVRRPVKARPE
jgi:hypothetical protein